MSGNVEERTKLPGWIEPRAYSKVTSLQVPLLLRNSLPVKPMLSPPEENPFALVVLVMLVVLVVPKGMAAAHEAAKGRTVNFMVVCHFLSAALGKLTLGLRSVETPWNERPLC